jgi:hypothetical protein
MLCNAAGTIGDLIFIVQVDKVPEGLYYKVEIPGLSAGGTVDAKGYIYYCSTRAGNAALWINYFETIAIPNMAKNATTFQFTVS